MTVTTHVMEDLRRDDLRVSVLGNPYWITSDSIPYTVQGAGASLAAVLFSFPVTESIHSPGYGNDLIIIQEVAFEVTTLFTGDYPAIDIGQGIIATDIEETTVTLVDHDMYLKNNDVTHGTVGWYMNGMFGAIWQTGRKGLDFSKEIKQTGSDPSPVNYPTWTILPADSNVICVVAYFTSEANTSYPHDQDDGTLTGGAGRLHMMVSRIPSTR